eukprot:318320_1
MSNKRKLSTDTDDVSLPMNKKRKLNNDKQENDDDDNKSKFSDPTDRNNDSGLSIEQIDNNNIDYTKYQPQVVRQIDITGCVHKICYPPNGNNNNNNLDTFDEDENKNSNSKINLDF